MTVTIHKLSHHDLNRFIELIGVFEDVFEMQQFVIPDSEHLQRLLSKNEFIVFVAIANNEVIGGLTAYVLEQYYATRPLAYIYDLAVETSFQRKGIGKELIKKFNEFCTEQGFEEVFVQADKKDVYALHFYRATGITEEEDVAHFYYTLQERKER